MANFYMERVDTLSRFKDINGSSSRSSSNSSRLVVSGVNDSIDFVSNLQENEIPREHPYRDEDLRDE